MWRRGLTIVLTLALMLSNAPPLSAKDLIKSVVVETQVYQDVLRAEGLIAGSQFGVARDILSKAAAQDPTTYSRAVHRDLSRCYRGLKQYDKAISEAKKALSFDPSYALLWYDIGAINYDAERYDDCINALNKFIAMTNDEGDRKLARDLIKQAGSYGYMRKGRIALDQDHYADAKKWLQKAATYDPSPYSGIVHSELCYVLRELGESGAAIEEGKRALSMGSADMQAQTTYSIAMAYSDMLRFDEAVTWMNKYLSLEPDAYRRKMAANTVAAIEDDREQYNNPNNKKADYMDVMRGSGEQVYWPKERIPLKVAIMPGTNVKGWKASFPNLVKVAMDTWCEASGKRIDYKLTNEPDEADIRVVWTKDPLDVTLDHPNVMATGLTNVDHVEGKMRSAVVSVRTVDPFHPDDIVDENECAHVVLHEIGHALGVGHSKFIRDVMYFRSARQQQALTPRDKATIARLYSGYPVIGFVPKQAPGAAPTVPVAPPAFLPPEAPDDSKVMPPMFVPPPLEDNEKLMPPMFTPPPVNAQPAAVPMFTPPPVKSASSAPKKTAPPKNDTVPIPLFTPPPAK